MRYRRFIGKARGKFCVKLMGLPSCATNGFSEMGFDIKSRKSKILGLIVEYWQRIMCSNIEAKNGRNGTRG
jgi:hypothetical protein